MAVPINPNDAKQSHLPTTAELDKLIEDVNETLRAYDGAHPIYVPADKLGRTRLARERVSQMFRQCGWKVDFHFDQREGDAYSFTEAPPYVADPRDD